MKSIPITDLQALVMVQALESGFDFDEARLIVDVGFGVMYPLITGKHEYEDWDRAIELRTRFLRARALGILFLDVSMKVRIAAGDPAAIKWHQKSGPYMPDRVASALEVLTRETGFSPLIKEGDLAAVLVGPDYAFPDPALA